MRDGMYCIRCGTPIVAGATACGTCGTPMPAPVPPPPWSGSSAGVPPAPPANTSNPAFVILLIMLILLSIGGGILAAVLLLPPMSTDGIQPQVVFAPPVTIGPGVWRITVTGVSQNVEHHRYGVMVLNQSATAISETELEVVESMGVMEGGLDLQFTDFGGSGAGRLTGGDFFTLSPLSGSATYDLLLLWDASGEIITQVTI